MSVDLRAEQLATEVETLRQQLQEAEETLSAIRSGEVDALVVNEGPRGERVYTLKSPDRPWRLMIEEMHQGAVTATPGGTLLWCNPGFARMLRTPAFNLVGGSVRSYVAPESRELVDALLERSGSGEVELLAPDGFRVPAFLAVTSLSLEDEPILGLVVTDLTEQKRNEQIVADELLARSILEHASEAMVVCDTQGRIVRASGEAHRLRGRNVLLEPFAGAFPLELADPGTPDVVGFLSKVLEGHRLRGVEAALVGPGGRLDLMLSAGPLWAADRQIEGCVVTLTDITARRRVERELEQAWAAAEAMNEAKDRFLAQLSHELRTPLTPVLAVLSSLESGPGHQPELSGELAMMRRNIELEARLIDDLLDLTRISRGKIDLQRVVTDLREVLDHAAQTSCGEAVAAGRIALVADLPREGEWALWADASRLTQVFWNLLNNAVKFTPEGGSIHVRLRREEEPPFLVAEVVDTGVGIEAELLPRIFDAFEQGGPGVAHRSGLGLGLAISKAIVELHGGEVAVRSGGRDQGATFTVRLPAEPLPEGAQDTSSLSATEPLTQEPSDRTLHVLLVEDHPDTAEALAELLRTRGYQVSRAGSLAEAFSLADSLGSVSERSGGIDLVVSDLGLPDGTGLDLMRELSRRHGLSGIALSGYGMEEDVRKSHEAGFSRHLTKPVDVRALVEAIQSVS
jgi:signal transduction histidine kinase/ActR/RegA family two-component response regulator